MRSVNDVSARLPVSKALSRKKPSQPREYARRRRPAKFLTIRPWSEAMVGYRPTVALRIVRLGSPRSAGEGLRLGTVRRPPRGVPKREFARRDYYDLWLPLLAPSAALLKQAQPDGGEKAWARFARKFTSELERGPGKHVLDLLAALSHGADFSLGCYCADEQRCHRSVL